MLQHLLQGASRLRLRAGSSTAWRIFVLFILLSALPSQTFAGPFVGLVELWGVVDQTSYAIPGLSAGDPLFTWFTFRLNDFNGDSGSLTCTSIGAWWTCNPPSDPMHNVFNMFLSTGGTPGLAGWDIYRLDIAGYGTPGFAMHISFAAGKFDELELPAT